MYLSNKYTEWYNRIILRAQTRNLPETIYVERHHIIPKSMGGSDDPCNLVKLTPREHFVCHRLLPKMTTGQNKYKMVYALFSMSYRSTTQRWRDYTVTSRVYSTLKQLMSDAWSGQNNVARRPDMRERRRITCTENNPSKGKSWITNGVDEMLVHFDSHQLADGWYKGRLNHAGFAIAGSRGKGKVKSKETRQNMSGKFWWTDGQTEIKSLHCPVGFRRGRKVQ